MTAPLVAVTVACPECGGRLLLRERRRDQQRFVGCSGWPSCSWTCDFIEREQQVALRLADAERRLRFAEAERDALADQLAAGAVLVPEELGKVLREVVALVHPDRHGERCQRLAHEAVVRLNDLRRRCAA